MIALFDLDGVLVDFARGVEDMFGPVSPETKKGLDIAAWYNMKPERFWSLLGASKFWSDLAPIKTGLQLYIKTIDAIGKENVFICSSPTLSPESLSGKYRWCQKHLGGYAMRNFIFTPHKYLFAGPGRILIDDFNANCDAFIERGGKAILYPQPWNGLGEVINSERFIDACIEMITYKKGESIASK